MPEIKKQFLINYDIYMVGVDQTETEERLKFILETLFRDGHIYDYDRTLEPIDVFDIMEDEG